MKNTIRALFVLISTFAFTSNSQAVDLSVGVSGNIGFFAATGTETNTTQVTKEYGGMETSHGAIFAELGINDAVSVGLEFVPTDIDSPDKVSIYEDQPHGSGTSVSSTNTAKVTFQNWYTLYAIAKLPAPGILDGTYLKLGYTEADVKTKENLGTGGSYNDTDINGIVAGLGYARTNDDGIFFRVELLGTDMNDVTAKNTTDTTKKVVISDVIGASASIKIGKKF